MHYGHEKRLRNSWQRVRGVLAINTMVDYVRILGFAPQKPK